LTNLVVQSSATQPGMRHTLTVMAFPASAHVGVSGATSVSPDDATTPSIALAPTAAGSWFFGVGNDWFGDTGPHTLGAGQSMAHELNDGSGTYWVEQLLVSPESLPGSVTLNVVSPSGDPSNFAAVEVVW
jgi:hypothetical protein